MATWTLKEKKKKQQQQQSRVFLKTKLRFLPKRGKARWKKELKNMETNFQFFFNLLEQKHENFIAAVRKWEMVAATKVKMGGSEEEVNRNKHSISSIKRVTGKYHVL